MDYEAVRRGNAEYVPRMQRKLHQWAKEGQVVRDTWGLVTSDAFLAEAWKRLDQNRGSRTAGVDGVTRSQVKRRGVNAFLTEVQAQLKTGTYKPSSIRRVEIPKGDGRTRSLGIPVLRDRLVQMVLKLVLEPVFEAAFLESSHGFRPGRNCHDAVHEIRRYGNRPTQYEYVVEADIEACFDNVDHRLLMQQVRRRVSDRKTLRLVSAFLQTGVLGDGWTVKDQRGVPQGGVLSPLLANAYMHVLDEWYQKRYHDLTHWQRVKRRRDGLPTCRLIRYADDFCVMVRGTREQAEEERGLLSEFLDRQLRMRLSPEKTLVTHVDQGIDFLGFTIRRAERRSGGLVMMSYPSRKSVARLMRRIKEWTSRNQTHLPLQVVLLHLNRLLGGWAAYFKHGASSRTFAYLEWYTWHAIHRWLRKKHRNRSWQWLARRYYQDGAWSHEGVRLFSVRTVHVQHWYPRPRNRPSPWDAPTTEPSKPIGCAESPVRGNAHAGFGGQCGETEP